MEKLDMLYERLRRELPGLELLRQELMSRHTTFRVGGPAALMALPRTEEEAAAVLRAAAELPVRPFFLGNGSNLLVADEGYPGLIVKYVGPGEVRETGGQLAAGAGLRLSQLAAAALDRGLTGLEFAHGIPGSVGGAVYMNAGAYGGEISQVLSSAAVLALDGTRRVVPVDGCGLGYRKSVFSGGDELIVEARFALRPGDRAEIKATMDDLAARRREKQPLEYPSAGSTFKRPEGHFAAALIDSCGLKGLTVGGAQVSTKHAGFVINTGGATCKDILALMEQVRERVFRETGVMLEPEVKYLR